MRLTQVLLSLMLMSFLLEAQILAQKKCRKQKIQNGRMLLRDKGSKAIYKCKRGFNLVGHNTSECLETRWTPAPPACIAADTTREARTITTISTTPRTKKSSTTADTTREALTITTISTTPRTKKSSTTAGFMSTTAFTTTKTMSITALPLVTTSTTPSATSSPPAAGSMSTTAFTTTKTMTITALPLVTTSTTPSATSSPPGEKSDCQRLNIANGRTEWKKPLKKLIFWCNSGFKMVGKNFTKCKDGRWTREAPKCNLITGALPNRTAMPSNVSDTKGGINLKIKSIKVSSGGSPPMDSSTTSSISSLAHVTNTGTSPKTSPKTTSSKPPTTTTTFTNPRTTVFPGTLTTQKTTGRIPEITSAPSSPFTTGVKDAEVTPGKRTVAISPSVLSTAMPFESDSSENRSSAPMSRLNTTSTKAEPVEQTNDSIPPASTSEISKEVETSKQTTSASEGSASPSVTPITSTKEMAASTKAVHSEMTSSPRLGVPTSPIPRKHGDTSEPQGSTIYTTISHVMTDHTTTARHRANNTISTTETNVVIPGTTGDNVTRTAPRNIPHPGISDKEPTMGSPNNEDGISFGSTSTVFPDSKPILVDSLKDTSTARVMPEVVVMTVGFVVGVIVIGVVAWLWERNRRKTAEAVGKDEEMGMQPVDAAAAVSGDDTTAVSGDDTTAVSGGDTTAVSGGETTAVSGGENTAVSGGDTTAVSADDTTAVSGDDTTAVSVDDTTAVSGRDTTAVSGDDTTAVSRGDTTAVTGDDTTAVSGDDATAVSGGDTTAVSGDDTTAVTGDDTTAVSGDDTK